jgi:hypothetical protein
MSRKSFLTIVALSLSLSTIATRPASAATVGDPLTAMVQAGWKPVSEGVLQRSKGGNKVESLVSGVKGFTWKLRQLEAQLEILISKRTPRSICGGPSPRSARRSSAPSR